MAILDQRVEQGVLDPEPSHVADRIGGGVGREHPALTAVGVALASYGALALGLIGLGFLMIHVLVHGSIGHWDVHADRWLAAHRTARWNTISAYFTHLADTLGIAVVAVGVTAGMVIRKVGRKAWLFVLGIGIELSVFLSTTYLVGRSRPGVPHVGGTPSTFSWPSGHVAATVVTYAGIALLVMSATRKVFPRALAWLLATALVLAVALSRVYRGEHYPSDVTAGLLLGIGALSAAVFVIRILGASGRHGAQGQPPAMKSELR